MESTQEKNTTSGAPSGTEVNTGTVAQVSTNTSSPEEKPQVCTQELPPITGDAQATASESTPHVCTAGFDNETGNGTSDSFVKRNKVVLVAVLAALIILGGAGFYAYQNFYAHGGVAANVNGERIYKDELDESVRLITQAATEQGATLAQLGSPEELRTQALDVLINNRLIIAAATAAGITASKDDVESKYQELAKQMGSEDKLKEKMNEMGLTDQKLRDNIRDRIITDGYIEKNANVKNITVTDDEVKAALETIKANSGTSTPPLAEIKPQIEEMLKNQKQQQAIEALLTKLRTDAKVDIKI